jgi:hypothetical protein
VKKQVKVNHKAQSIKHHIELAMVDGRFLVHTSSNNSQSAIIVIVLSIFTITE